MMATTRVRLLTFTQILIFSSTLLCSTGKEDKDFIGFIETPVDVEFKNQKDIFLDCRYSIPVKRCIWYKDNWIVRSKNELHVRFIYNESQGLCNIALRRPQMGLHTCKWRCEVEKLDGTTETTSEIVIYAKNVPRTSYFDDFVSFELMHMSQNPHKMATIRLEMLTMHETRIRWFADDQMVQSIHDEKVDLLKVDSNRVFSSTTLDVSGLGKADFKVVRCCVEFRAELKEYKIFTVYVVNDNYDTDYRLAKENVVSQSYNVTVPRPFLIMNGQEVEDLFLRVQVSYPHLHDIHFTCGEADAFPSSILAWQVRTTDVDAASDLLEFNKTEQALEETETIALHTIFRNPNSRVIVACHAYNILAPKKFQKVAQVHVSLQYEPPTCPTDGLVKQKIAGDIASNVFSLYNTVILFIIIGIIHILTK